MKKKTIKFYFFNSIVNLKNPSTNSLFCFSKRAFYQNSLTRKYMFFSRLFSKKKKVSNFFKIQRYNILLKNKIKMNQ